MNKYQEALNNLVKSSCPQKTICRECDIKAICNSEAKGWIDTVQELIDKETPKKVREATKEDYEESGYQYCCPVCGKMVGTKVEGGVEQDDYCCSCGQRLDWSDADE
ncbi:hypothetical protein MKC46_17600 [[Clostridium] innocuum]|nr:hypothetical protein [[Clostridium] innocuum]